MNAWKKVFKNVTADILQIKKEFIVFSAISFLLSITYTVIANLMLPKMGEWVYGFLILGFSVLLSLFDFINQFYFQKMYTKSKNMNIKLNSLRKTLFHSIKVYFFQLLIVLMLIVLIVFFAIIILFVFLKIESTRLIYGISNVVIIGMLLWFYRLTFVSFILLYKRNNYKSRCLIKESLYIIKKNAVVVLPLFIIPVLSMLFFFITPSLNLVAVEANIIYKILAMLFSFISTVLFISICIHTLNENKNQFLLETEEIKGIEEKVEI